jgi:hypothetical protein
MDSALRLFHPAERRLADPLITDSTNLLPGWINLSFLGSQPVRPIPAGGDARPTKFLHNLWVGYNPMSNCLSLLLK